MVRRLLLAAALCALTPSVAHAQIYAWRDTAGNLVLSDTPKDPSAKTYAVTPAAGTPSGGIRTTKVAFSRRAAEYNDLIVEHSTRHALSPDFVRAVIQAESAFNPRARSLKGAMGLMQLMPQTARAYGVFDPFNAAENIRAGVAYLRSLLDRFNQDESLALAAYNAGPAAVEKYGRSVPPYKETRSYVAKIRGAASQPAAPPATRVFKTIDIIDGRPVIRYTNKPAEGANVVTAADRR
ncbi:MAG: lytic transglycosylase [Acidobacteria bacterium]|nr:MAG: lytic transglycosylase [Acidobacteriota bacterium]